MYSFQQQFGQKIIQRFSNYSDPGDCDQPGVSRKIHLRCQPRRNLQRFNSPRRTIQAENNQHQISWHTSKMLARSARWESTVWAEHKSSAGKNTDNRSTKSPLSANDTKALSSANDQRGNQNKHSLNCICQQLTPNQQNELRQRRKMLTERNSAKTQQNRRKLQPKQHLQTGIASQWHASMRSGKTLQNRRETPARRKCRRKTKQNSTGAPHRRRQKPDHRTRPTRHAGQVTRTRVVRKHQARGSAPDSPEAPQQLIERSSLLCGKDTDVQVIIPTDYNSYNNQKIHYLNKLLHINYSKKIFLTT